MKQLIKNRYGYDDAVKSARNLSETVAHLQTRNFGLGITFETSDLTIRRYATSYIEFLNLK